MKTKTKSRQAPDLDLDPKAAKETETLAKNADAENDIRIKAKQQRMNFVRKMLIPAMLKKGAAIQPDIEAALIEQYDAGVKKLKLKRKTVV